MKSCLRLSPCVLFSLLLSAAATAAHAYKWPAWDRAELAETKGRVDPEAGAEIILSTLEVDHRDLLNMTEEYYYRVRIFNASALEKFSKIEIPYESGESIEGVMARTIKPDGTVQEISRKDVYDREVVKSGRERVRVKAFAPPGLEEGCILEYRYVKEPESFVVWIHMQEDVPVRLFQCEVFPYASAEFRMNSYVFRSPRTVQFIYDKKSGSSKLEYAGIPAAREEPFSPPEIETRASAMLYYRSEDRKLNSAFWEDSARILFDDGAKATKRNKVIDAAAATLVSPGDQPEEKLRKFYDYCRTGIQNTDRDTFVMTAAERKKLPRNKSPADTLKHKLGSSEEINHLFAALAATTGLETRLAVMNNRNLMMASPDNVSDFTMYHEVVAVKILGDWTYYDPGQTYLPFGMLSWRNTDTCYLLAEKKGGVVKMMAGPPAEASVQRRRAQLSLDESGTLEGDVQIRYEGLWEADMKYNYDDRTSEEREEQVKEDVTDLMPRAEVTDIKVENAADPVRPLTVSYHMRVPGYAERTGSRLFLEPAVFQKGTKPLFQAPTRDADIVFEYRYTEDDTVQIHLPEGYALEARSAPESQNFGQLGFYRVQLGMGEGKGNLVYKRLLSIGMMGLAAKHYKVVRTVFEVVHDQDGHLITLKREEPEPEAPQAAEPAN